MKQAWCGDRAYYDNHRPTVHADLGGELSGIPSDHGTPDLHGSEMGLLERGCAFKINDPKWLTERLE